jgi:hypothetical protein
MIKRARVLWMSALLRPPPAFAKASAGKPAEALAKAGGGGGNRTRVRRTSASKDYVRIQSVKFRERNVRTGRSAHSLAPKFRSEFRSLNPNLSCCVSPRPALAGKSGET